MNNKVAISIAVGVIILGVGLVFGSKYLFKEEKSALSQKIATSSNNDLIKNVVVEVVPSSDNKEIVLKISNLSDFTSLEYELSYDTDKGPKGTLSGSKPIALSDGQEEFTRTVTLGTCSKNDCTYDTGVKNLTVILKLYPKEGEPQILKKSFDI